MFFFLFVFVLFFFFFSKTELNSLWQRCIIHMRESGEQLLAGEGGVLLHGLCLIGSNREGSEPVIPGDDHEVAVDDN